MIRVVPLAVVVLTAATALPAAAQSTFERLETVAVAMNALMNEGFVQQIPALDGNLPAPEWDDGLRAAYRCMVDGYVTEVGDAPVEAMVSDMEAALPDLTPQQMIDGTGPLFTPEGLSDDAALQIVEDCGMMEAFMARLDASGAMDILTQQ